MVGHSLAALSGGGAESSGQRQTADERGDFVPGFADDDRLAVLDLTRQQIQICRGSIHDYRQSGDAGRRLDAPGSTLDDLGRDTGAVQFLSNVADDFKPAQLE